MKKFVIAGTLVTALALGGPALAQTAQPAAKQPAAGATKQAPKPPAAAPAAEQPAAGQTADMPAAPKKKARAHAATGENAAASHTAPKAQPGTAPEAAAPDGSMSLGTVHIPKGLKADGKDLPAGMYTVRLTPDEAKPDAKGSTEKLERWAEFVKGGQVVAREVVTIVPSTEKQLVQKDTPPPANGSKVETLKGGDYVRIWLNKGGNYYLMHLPKA
jgi:hypothetical protein